MKRENPYAKETPRKTVWASRLIFFGIALVALGAAGFLIFGELRRSFYQSQIVQDGGAPGLSPTERFYLQAYLVARIDDLDKPAGRATAPTPFEITAGQGAGQIADNLAAADLLSDRDLFLNYARYYGYDSQLEAGKFLIQPPVTIPELAQTLTQAYADEIAVTFLEGWRIEEMARYLDTRDVPQLDTAEFLAIAQRRRPFDLSPYDFLASLPPDTTLEGYLFPDTYRLPLDADAAYLVALMLENFGSRVTPALRQAFGTQGLSLHEAVTLASIVEREAVLADEQPLIAGVFLNRLAQDIKLQADPTVQYALGYWAEGDSWWKTHLWVDDLEHNSPYNTYVHSGLTPGPIANPGLGALEAVAHPAETDYLFFVANCTAAGAHAFSATYEEHVAHVERCR